MTPATTDINRPITGVTIRGTADVRGFHIIDSTLDETPITDDSEFMGRIQNGIAQMERGEFLTADEVFGAEQG